MLTIIIPPTSTDLTNLATVKAELGLTGTADDAWLATIISAQSAAIASHCRRTFGRASYGETFPAPKATGGYSRPVQRVVLSVVPVANVASITEDGAALNPADFEVDPPSGLVWRLDAQGHEVEWPNRRIVVAYSAGWLLPGRDLPADIERACLLAVGAAWHGRSRDPALRSEAVDGVLNRSWQVGAGAAALSAEVQALLAPYVAPALL
jgi:hypothetical protein